MFPLRTVKAGVVVLLALMLSACGLTQPQVKYDTTVLVPQDNLLQDCPVAAPPNKEEFQLLTSDEQVQSISKAYNQQTLNVGLCNKDKQGLRYWKKEELEKVKGKSK